MQRPCKTRGRGRGLTDAPKDPETRLDAILRDFAADLGPAAEKIKSLLDALDAGKDVRDEARKLAEELPDLMADDPAMAAVIEEAMADAFAEGAGEGGEQGTGNGEEAALNKEGECRAQDPAHCPVHGTPEAKADATHTPEEQKTIEEYRASTNQEVTDFYIRMQSADKWTQDHSEVKICQASDSLGSTLKELTGVDATGWDVKLNGGRAFHICDRRGENGKHDHSLKPEDVGRLGYVFGNFDSAELLKDQNGKQVYNGQFRDSKNKPSPEILIRKKIDGTYSVQEVVPDSKRKTIWIVTARIEKR